MPCLRYLFNLGVVVRCFFQAVKRLEMQQFLLVGEVDPSKYTSQSLESANAGKENC